MLEASYRAGARYVMADGLLGLGEGADRPYKEDQRHGGEDEDLGKEGDMVVGAYRCTTWDFQL